MLWPKIGVLLVYTGLVIAQRVQKTALRCETDKECPAPSVCRLICKRTCRSVCIKLKPAKQVILDDQQLQLASYENDSPFSTRSDMFVESIVETTTPVMISEMQIESKEILGINDIDQQIDEEPFQEEVLPSLINEFPRGPPSPPRSNIATRVPPAPLDFNENSVLDFTEPPRVRVTIPKGPVPIPNGPPSSIEAPESEIPCIPPLNRARSILPPTVTTLPWRKTRLSTIGLPLPFRGQIQTVHKLPNIIEKPAIRQECPSPPICEKNCGVSIDKYGCQTCQCMWLSSPCRHNQDCPEHGQFCDLGRCECRAGFVHSKTRSGVCEREILDLASKIQPSGIFQLNGAKNLAEKAYKSRPRRSDLLSQKPNREERLQWPGPCESDSDCAPNLYCINSDCWHLPEKPLRSFQIESMEIRRSESIKTNDDSFPLQNSDYEETESPQILPPSIMPEDVITTLRAPETTTVSKMTTSIDGFITRPSKSNRKTKPKALSAPIQSSDDYDPLPELSTESSLSQTTLSEPISDDELDKEIGLEESISESTVITNDQLDKEVVTHHPSTKMPEFTKSTKRSEEWKEMKPTTETEVKITTTQSSQLKNKMAPVFLDYSNRRNKPVRIEAFNAKDKIKDECKKTEDCGKRYVCCAKRFCDLSFKCGNGRFCLPDCRLTKMIHPPGTFQPNQTMIDFVYD